MNDKRLRFLFAIHCHQPVGNFESVFEECYQKCYRPFIDVLSAFPQVRCSLHYSGPLLLFIEKKHSEHLNLLRRMTARGQIEWIGGGFYEPILSVIPKDDAVIQIAKMREWIWDHFKFKTRGLWLAERVWEPGLPSVLREAGVEFTLMDDTHFLNAGVSPDEMLGYYRTEDNGKSLDVFPIDWTLRKAIPFYGLDETFGYMWKLNQRRPGSTVTLGDDGEKFGIWPGTHKHVYEEKYLERFFDRVMKSAEWLETVHFSDVRASEPARGMVYMPTASYQEMTEWALPYEARLVYEDIVKEVKARGDHERFERFLRGAHWRNFFGKYPESNLMHKKMLYLSGKLHRQKPSSEAARKRWNAAYDSLMRGQCNCAYWHGLFGGLYLGHLRQGVYHSLLEAENGFKSVAREGEKIQVEQLDFDCDGQEEVLVSGPVYNLYLQPHYGGSVFEFDVLPLRANLSNVLTRRPEPYHLKIAAAEKKINNKLESIHDSNSVKEKGLENKIVHDWYLRRMFQDHFLAPDATLERFSRADCGEIGDFINQPYQLLNVSSSSTGGATLSLERKGGVYRNSVRNPITLKKTFYLKKEIGRVEYEILPTQESAEPIQALFGVELNLILPDAISPGQYLSINGVENSGLADPKDLKDVHSVALIDDAKDMKFSLKASEKFNLWAFPIETVSQSESGLERTYQGTSLLFWWPLELVSHQKQKITLEFKLALA